MPSKIFWYLSYNSSIRTIRWRGDEVSCSLGQTIRTITWHVRRTYNNNVREQRYVPRKKDEHEKAFIEHLVSWDGMNHQILGWFRSSTEAKYCVSVIHPLSSFGYIGYIKIWTLPSPMQLLFIMITKMQRNCS